ncbi:hypothetical protein OY671_008399, partial [Metschnikowia pulcherrima]
MEGGRGTLAGIGGTAARAVGTQMAVSGDGRHAGSFSGGCIEAAVIAEASDVSARGEGRVIRYGSGSPYIDIRSPCGGGIDSLFTPCRDARSIVAVSGASARREPMALALGVAGAAPTVADTAAGWSADAFVQHYVPPSRSVAVGQGEDLAALARSAMAFGIEVVAHAPERDPLMREAAGAMAVHPMASHAAEVAFESDAWTAIVFSFHDHDWEEASSPRASAAPAFYHGAIGSRRTHRARVDMSRAAGVPESRIDALRGSIGSIPSTRDPATLAS